MNVPGREPDMPEHIQGRLIVAMMVVLLVFVIASTVLVTCGAWDSCREVDPHKSYGPDDGGPAKEAVARLKSP